MEKVKVSIPQFFSLLYLSVLSSVFMYISSPGITISETDSLLRPVVFVGVSIMSALPVFFIYKVLNQNQNLSEKLYKSKFCKAIAIIYSAVYLLGIVRTTARFDLFASSELFPGAEMTLFIISIVIVCALLSLLGLGALSRAGVIFTFIVVCATGFVMLSLLEEISVLNFTPLFQDGLGQFFSDSLLFSLQASEIGVLITVLPEIKGNLKKGFVWWAALSGITFVAVLFFVVGTLGVFADTQLFPTYTAVTLAKFGLLQRMDALETAIWILCVVEKIALYFWVVTKNLKLLFPKVKSSILCLAQVIPVCGVLVFISGNLERFSFVSYTPVVAGMYIIPVIILPVSVLIYLKKVKKSEKSPQQL